MMRDPREDSPDELDALLASGAFADDDEQFAREYQEWLDMRAEEQYGEYQMKKIAAQYGEEF
jgi:hypothetical protein